MCSKPSKEDISLEAAESHLSHGGLDGSGGSRIPLVPRRPGRIGRQQNPTCPTEAWTDWVAAALAPVVWREPGAEGEAGTDVSGRAD